MSQIEQFKDILVARREEFSNLLWVSRKLETVPAFKQNTKPKPEMHKKEVLTSLRMKDVMEKISKETGKSEEEIQSLVRLILDEIGFNKQLKIIRWLGLALAKINQKIYTGIHVNEDSIARVKSAMSKCPVIFAPSHRSYADFILMSYVCFTYDIEIPAIAAGMDFHGMWGMGSVLRDTGAFFMRRTFNDDALYWETFKQYVHQIVTRGDLPIEFFIEGTRSRSCKSLIPKFGLLSMILKPLFTSEVPDILIVPINISYERVLEEKLFAFELLGIPKPKESTSGMFKSLSIIKENYGNIYVDFTTPISAKQFFGDKLNQLAHTMSPVHKQQLNYDDRKLISDMGYEILRVQRQHAVLLPFNLAAILLTTNHSSLSTLASEMTWLREILETLGAKVINGSLNDAFKVHSGLVKVTDGVNIELIRNEINLDNIDANKLKAHRLSNETMTNIIPHIMLQLYVNPTLHYFVDCCFVIVGVLAFGQARSISKDELFDSFRFLRTIFSYEFAFYNKREDMVFEETLQKLEQLSVLEIINSDVIVLGSNIKLQTLLINLLSPFITAYCTLCHVFQMISIMSLVDHKDALSETQRQLEASFITNKSVHPYSLNLDTLSICLQSLSSFGALEKIKENNKVNYKVNIDKLQMIATKLNQISAKCYKYYTNTSSEVSNNVTAKL